MLPHWERAEQRKGDLVSLGFWALRTGRGWLVQAIHVALIEEALTHG